MAGSNDLNLLLKAKVVKLKVELDYKGSKLPAQVDGISKKLANKPVKLKVKLDVTIKDLNAQLSKLHARLGNSKSMKPVKIAVQIDVKGSAQNIKKQLDEVYKTVEKFNQQYGKQIQQMQQKTQQASNNIASSTKNQANAFGGAIDPSAYMKSLKDAERYMKTTFGKGLFSSQELKDANGVLTGFTTSLTKANGVVQKIHYQWNQNKGTFTPISQKTMTDTERTIANAKKSLQNLYSDIEKLDKGKGQSNLFKSYQELEKRASQGTLNMDMVSGLQRMIKEEGVLQSQIRLSNDELLKQKKLLADIEKAKKADWKATGDFERRKQYTSLSNDVKNNPNLKEQAFQLARINDLSQKQIKDEKELIKNTKQRMQALKQIRELDSKIVSNNTSEKALAREAKFLAQRAKSAQEWLEVQKKINSLQQGNSDTAMRNSSVKYQRSIESNLRRLVDLGKMTDTEFNKAMAQLPLTASRSFADLERQYHQLNNRIKMENEEMKRIANQTKTIFAGNTGQAQSLKSLVGTGSISELQNYFSHMYKGKVETMSMIDTTDRLGRAVTEMKIKMAGSGKQVQTYTVQMERANGALRQTAQSLDYNANRNLGVFEQLKIAMARVPVWMMAMTAFYGSIRTVKEMTSEILQLDKALTELRRVADKQINIDHIFKGAIDLSKELGNNIHDVMQSVNDLARTFGDFNERQLLSIARTATLMSNVSDLTAQEATESLIGTMNAFNITAEDSIRIVDSMNEVDNNYAISTKQLATGLAKSASTARTFGVTMEENIGHITAIGAVTMESGNIIGNSLKTIYSRITTIQDAKDILESVGVAVYDMNGQILPTNDIIQDLASKWRDLSDEQRQNIGVTVAGRYQLSRFLALMNNYGMATKATQTALTSQGSAIRENAQYMKSFEARINQLKNGFTELSNAIGEAFLASGLSIGISALTSLANVAIKVVDTMGALPTLFGLITIALLKFGVFNKLTASIAGGLTRIGTSITSVTAQTTLMGTTTARVTAGARASWAMMGAGVQAVAGRITASASAMFLAIKTGFTSMLASTGIGLAFVALGYGIEWIVKKFSEQKAEQEELIKTNEKMIKSYRDTGDGMQDMFSRYDELTQKKKDNVALSQKETDELNLLTNQFAEQLPLSVKYYTASGEAVLKSTEEIKKQIEAVKELSAEQAKLDNMKLQENVKKGSDDYLKNLKKVKKVQEEMKNMQNNADIYEAQYGQKIDVSGSKAFQELKVKEMMLNQKLTGSMQDVVIALQKQSLAYFEANGKMVGFTDGQIGVIEKMSMMNDEFIRTATTEEEFVQVSETLIDSSIRVGEVFSEAFNIMSESVKDNPEELQKLKTSLDSVAKSIPDDFLKVDKNDPVGSTNKIITSLKELINVSTHVKDGTASNFDELASRLEATGMSSEDAKNAVYNLANEYNNAKLKAEAMKQGVDGVTSSAEEMNDVLLESVDVVAEVFGFGNQDFSALKSQIELMEILYDKYGESAESKEAFIGAQQAIAETLGITSDKVKDNLHDYNLVFQALQDLKVVTDEQGGSYLNITEITKGMTQAQKDLLNEVLNAKDAMGDVSGIASEAGKSMGEVGKSVIDLRNQTGEPFPTIKAPTIEDAGFKNQFNDVLKTRQTLLDNSKSLAGIIGDVNATGKNLGNVQADLQNVSKEADTTKNKAKEAGTTMSQSFASASKAVKSNTDSMVSKHNTQTGALNTLATSARNANRDISGLNSNAVNSMNTLSKLQSRMNTFNAQAQSASANINNRFAQNSVNPLSYNSADNTLSQSISSFSATSEGASGSDSFSVSGGGGEGTSGIIRTPINNFVDKFTALHNTVGVGSGSSSSSTSSSSSKKTSTSSKSASRSASDTKKKAEELAELYVIDMLARKRTGYETTLNALEAKLKGLSENTKAYRDQLRKVYEYENLVLNINKEELSVTRQKNQNITKRLNELKNVTKHTKEQREEYNKLQQEYDSNLSKISSLTGTIENAIVDLRKKSESIFLDFVDEIINNFDKAFKAIEGRLDNLDFEMEVLELTDPENVTGKIDLLINKTVELVRQRDMLEKERKRLEVDVATAVQKYGANSESVAKLNEELYKNREAWEDVTISILRAEKEVRDTRGEMADKIVNMIKDNYKEMEKSATTAIDNELKALKKAHDEKIKIYDDEIKKINEVYDAKLKSLDKEKDEDNYEKEKDEKVKNLSELQKKETQYSKDNTLEGRKKYAEIKEEREKAQQELDEFIKNRQLELLKEQLNAERDALIAGLEQKKDAESESNDAKIESLETEKEAISTHYASITEDEKRWAKVREELIKGNFGVVKTELETMGITLEQISNGTFNTLSTNFATYSEQVRNFVNEMNAMIGKLAPTEISANVPSGGTQNGAGVGKMTEAWLVPEIIRKAKNNVKLDDPTADKSNIYGILKNSSVDEETLNLMFKKAQKGEAMSHPTAEKNMIYDLFLEILGRKKNQVPRFNTGGYTGNWSDNNGRVAILDKKELVLNEGQTSDILDIVEILGRVANVIPTPNRSTPRVDDMKFGDKGAVNNYELTVQIDKLNGDKSGADLVVKELMKGLKKMGK